MSSAAPASPARRRMSWLAIGVLVAAVLAAYANSLRAPFVYDDTLAIPENPTIRKLWPLTAVLLPQAEGGLTVSGRPMLNLSFAVNYAISGTDVWSYHLLNALLHAGAALALFGIARRTLRRATSTDRDTIHAERVVFAIAGLWALHPLHTQAITYTVQRAESLMGFFYLLMLYAFVRQVECQTSDNACERRAPRAWAALSVGACILGMATKEVMATAPLLVGLYDRAFVAGSFRAAWRARRGYYVALGATWLVLAALVLSTGGNRGGTVGLGVGLPLWAYPLTQFEALARYLGLSGWPHPLVFEYGTFWVQRLADAAPFAIVVLPLLAATVCALWPRRSAPNGRWPAAGFLGAWFFLILAPTSLAPGTIQMIVEHRMYLPLAAVVSALVLAAWRVAGAKAVTSLIVAAPALALLTAARNHDYRSALALWTDTLAKRPHNPRAHEGLAEALAAAGRVEEAIRAREHSVRLQPEEAKYHYNLALTLAEAGRTQEAVQKYRDALRLHPGEPRTHNNLAVLLVQLGRHDEALGHYEAAVRLSPANPLFHYNLGVALMRGGRPADAAASYEAALRLQPEYPDAHFNLGTALVRLGRAVEALPHYEAATRARPDDAEYGVTFGGALLLARRAEDALAQFQRVLARHPDAIEAAFGAGNALAALGRFDEAVAQYEAVLRRKPEHASAHFKLGNALLDLDRVADAIPHYEAARRLAPGDAEAHHNLGIAFARLERWDDARRAFDEALRLKPDYADARRSREQLRRATGR